MPQTPQQRARAKIRHRNDQPGHADVIPEREQRICEYLANHPGAERRAIFDALAGPRGRRPNKTGKALAALVKRGTVVRIAIPGHATLKNGSYMLKEQRARVRWALIVDDEPTEKGGTNG